MKKTKLLSAALVCSLAISAFAGCSKEDTKETTTASSGKEETTTVAAEIESVNKDEVKEAVASNLKDNDKAKDAASSVKEIASELGIVEGGKSSDSSDPDTPATGETEEAEVDIAAAKKAAAEFFEEYLTEGVLAKADVNVDLDFDIMKDMTDIYGDVDVDASVSGLVTPWTDKGLGFAGFGSVKGAVSMSDDKLELDYVGGAYFQLSKEMDKIDAWASGLFADEVSGEENDKNIYHTSQEISEEDFKEIVAEFKEAIASYEEMLTMYTGEDAEAVVEDVDTQKVEDFYEELSQKITDSLVISDDVVKYDGYDCYEMTSSINLGELGLVEFAQELAGDEAELDQETIDMANMMLSSIQIDTTVYLNSAYEPRYFKVDLSKSDVQSLVREIFKMELIGEGISEDEFNSQYRDLITVDIDDLSFELSILKSDVKDMADYVSALGTVVEWTEED